MGEPAANPKRFVLQPHGDMVASSARELKGRLKGLLDGGVCELVIDFSAVEGIDSVGIGLLVATHNSLQKKGGRLALIHCSRDLLDLFCTMRLDSHFEIKGSGEAGSL
jgi:anti-anti-sigma factor